MIASSSNFYQVGASLQVNAPSYVRRQADEEFYQKLQAGKFCYVLNSRQMGKSSLRVQTMQRLQKEGTVCAAIDLTGIGKVTQEQWYGGIVYNLSESCQLEDRFDFDWQAWWQKHQTILSPVQCLNLFIEKVLLEKIQQPIVIFVDEIDKVLSQDFSLDDFFALIRFFQNQRVDNHIFQRLTFALLGVATPGDLIKNKSQTPFNIGEAIELHGFQIDEVEPLIRGLQERFNHPQEVMAEILDWTGGQPFLTQKLCKLMVEESEKDNSRSVEDVVKSRIIENWESQDDPEHLRTIRDRILSSEQRAGYLLELYQQIQQQVEVTASNSIEFSELRLSGLVVQREGKLRVYNRVYQQVFNQSWVETQLKNLRPYSEAFRAWVTSGYSDESRLLRGKTLEIAEKWAKGKDLSYQDKQFLAASREKEIQQKTTVVLILALLVAVSFGGSAMFFGNKAQQERQKLALLESEIKTVQQLSKLAGELRNENLTADSDEALRQAGLSFRVKDHNLKQAMLLASMSQAYQKLKKPDKAKQKITVSLKYFNNKVNKISSDEGLQIAILVKGNQGNILAETSKKQAIKAYTEAYNILKQYPDKTNPFKKDKIITAKDIELVHRELLKLQSNRNQEVWDSLKEHFYAELQNFLSAKNWREAGLKTDQIMLFLANREEERDIDFPQIENFSCPDLRRIDELWVKNSRENFGFSVQKDIWIKTGNRLGIKPEDWNDSDWQNYLRFASAVGWYNEQKDYASSQSGYWIGYPDNLQSINKDPYNSRVRGRLPNTLGVFFESTVSGHFIGSYIKRIYFFSRAATCQL